jgi:RNA polymerase sigma factor (TIGR02999 family)
VTALPPSPDPALTAWLNALGPDGEPPAGGQQREFDALYRELRRVARVHMRREDPGHTLSATALTHEAWLRTAAQSRTAWHSRGHFLSVASTMMRRILVNHAVARRTDKRGADRVPLTLSDSRVAGVAVPPDLLSVHESLLALEQQDPRAARVVELRFFGGLENEEIAQLLGISLATVKRDWTLARAWLHRDLQPGG